MLMGPRARMVGLAAMLPPGILQCNYKRKARGGREPAPLLSFHLRAVLDQLERGVVA